MVANIDRFTTMSQGIDPESFFQKAGILGVSNAVMGAAFVYVGAKIAPSNKRPVALILAAIGLISIGFALFPSVMLKNYWSIWSGAACMLGLGVTAYSVSSGDAEI